MNAQQIINLPKHGKEVSFDAHGKSFRLRRLERFTWCLSCPAHTHRVRFGNSQEIAEDITAAQESGALPGHTGRP